MQLSKIYSCFKKKNLVIIVSGKQLQHNKSVYKPTEANTINSFDFASETYCDTQ